jgi:hypothetical protein
VGRAGLFHDPEQVALAQYFKTKKSSSELVIFSYLKHFGRAGFCFATSFIATL